MTMSASKERVEAEEWNPESEIQLFLALEGLKPVGINKYFFMACIADRLSKALNREIGTDAIWTHLKTMYNLAALDEMEPLPFPNDQREFALPEAEFSSLLHRKKSSTSIEGPEAPGQTTKPEKNITVPATPLSSSSSSSSTSSSQEKHQHHTSRTSLNGTTGQSSSTIAASHNANPTSGSVHAGNSEEKRSSSNASSASRAQPSSRPPKRTRGSMSLESNSPSTTPPPVPVNMKRRRI